MSIRFKKWCQRSLPIVLVSTALLLGGCASTARFFEQTPIQIPSNGTVDSTTKSVTKEKHVPLATACKTSDVFITDLTKPTAQSMKMLPDGRLCPHKTNQENQFNYDARYHWDFS